MKRAQAALEFLTTYGWAFIVILVMIGALAYFGVLNPSKVTPSRCIVEAGFDCKDFKITSGTINILLFNRKGTGLTITSNNTLATSDAGTISSCNATGGGVDQSITINCSASFATSLGSKVKVDFNIPYIINGGTFTQTAQGSVYGTVQ